MLALTFGVTSFGFFIAGAFSIVFGILILINPNILAEITVNMFTSRVTDPNIAFFSLFVVGIIIIIFGALFLVLTSSILKWAGIADKKLAVFVDKNVPKTGKVLEKVKGHSEPTDKLSKLERLANLKERGILTEEEFQQEKRLVLKETQ